MDEFRKIYTLKEFWENRSMPDGLYAVWVNELFFDNIEGLLNGIKGSIVTYSSEQGFSDELDVWADDFSDTRIRVKFLEELEIDF